MYDEHLVIDNFFTLEHFTYELGKIKLIELNKPFAHRRKYNIVVHTKQKPIVFYLVSAKENEIEKAESILERFHIKVVRY